MAIVNINEIMEGLLMNIMIAAGYAAPKSGNFIASILALGRRLRESGDRVVFVFPEEREWIRWLREEKFAVEILSKSSKVGAKEADQLLMLLKLIKKYQINLIHSHFSLFHHTLVFHRNKLENIKIIIHDHMGFGLSPNMAIQYFNLAAYSLLYRMKNINVIAVMEKKKNAYILLKNKWFVPNGLSLERYIHRSMEREQCRKELGLKNSDKCVFLLGWDLKRKGLDIALKAVQKCREIDDNICFGMIGVGAEPTDYAKEFIHRETGIDPSEPWIHFFDSYEDMFAVYRAVDVYLMASRHEGFPYALLESISQDAPVVVSNIPSTKWARVYHNSYFYPTEDVDACAGEILRALSNGRKETNSAEIVTRYGIDQWCDKVIEIYRTVN